MRCWVRVENGAGWELTVAGWHSLEREAVATAAVVAIGGDSGGSWCSVPDAGTPVPICAPCESEL
jgi:hypothetical protein